MKSCRVRQKIERQCEKSEREGKGDNVAWEKVKGESVEKEVEVERH